MRMRMLVMLATATLVSAAHAQDDQPEVVQQVSTTQAHLQEMFPPSRQPRSAAPLMARLLGKVLSAQFKDVRVDLVTDPDTPAAGAPYQGALHLNRRAEICFDNYRVGLKRDGVAMRYELSF